jgi:hypothetical protein
MKRKDIEVKVVPRRLLKGQRSRFVLGRCLVRISAGTPAELIEVYRGFPQTLHVNVWILPSPDDGCFLPNPFQVTVHQSSYYSTLYTLRYIY